MNNTLINSPSSWIFIIGISIIAYILMTSRYRERNRAAKRKLQFEEWLSQRGEYTQDMFYHEVKKIRVSLEIAQILVDLINTGLPFFTEDKIYPKLDDELYAIWGIDEEIEDIINSILTKFKVPARVNWNDKVILEIGTIKDLLLYLDDKIYAFPFKK